VTVELGITTFAETHPVDGVPTSAEERLAQVLDEVVLAEQAGLDVYGVGEHHRPDFAASAPAVVLAAAAARTSRIRLQSAVTVLSTTDPVRVFQDFATVDLISHGRAEIIAGRGSFTESFPLFGADLGDYDALFAEKLQLLLALRSSERVTWSGQFRPPLVDQPVYPRPVQDPLPVWVGVGGNPSSVVRAGLLGLPLVLAIIGGEPARFGALTDLYSRALAEAGHPPQPVAVNAHGYVAASNEQALEEFYGPYARAMTVLGRERGWPAMNRHTFAQLASPEGSLVIGDPATVADKILRIQETLGISRFQLHTSVGTMPTEQVGRCIELLGSDVAKRLA
jgi:probable LLM family oxidoreductase